MKAQFSYLKIYIFMVDKRIEESILFSFLKWYTIIGDSMNLLELFISLGYSKEDYEKIRFYSTLINLSDDTLYKK